MLTTTKRRPSLQNKIEMNTLIFLSKLYMILTMLFRDSKTVHSTACKLERKISRGASLACVPGGFPVRPSFAFCEYGIEVYSRAKAYPRSNVKKRGRGAGKKHRPSPIVFSIDLC